MKQDSAVAGAVLTLSPGQQAPAKLDHEFIVAVGRLGDEPSPVLPADADGGRAVDLVHHGENLIGIALMIVLLPKVEVVKRFAIEKPDGCGRLNGGLLTRCEQRQRSQ